MRVFTFALCVFVLPFTSAFITYVFISSHSNGINLDPTQAAMVCLGLLQMLLLGSTGVFPIDLDDVLYRTWGHRKKRDTSLQNLYEPPSVEEMPCIRRFMCEVETAARTSDSYNPEPSQNFEDRYPEEEVDVEVPDPLTELYVEAINAMYGHDKPTSPEATNSTERALRAIKSLTGDSCETAYKLCPGRYTAPMVFKSIFEELGYRAKDEL